MDKKATTKTVSRWEPLPENASTMQVLIIPEVDEQLFHYEDLPREDLIKFSKYIEQSNKTLEVENMIIEKYLNGTDPNILANMSQILESAAVTLKKIEKFGQLGVRKSISSVSKDTDSKSTFCSSSDSQRTDTTKSGSIKLEYLGLSDKKLKVQLLQKIEMVDKEMKDLKNNVDDFRKSANKIIYDLKYRSEEMSQRLAEIIQAQITFDEKLLVEGLDSNTRTLPGEKFLRHIEKILKQEEIDVGRLQIKNGCLKNQLKRVKTKLRQKKEIAGEIDSIDFEQLKVENKDCQEILSEKSSHLNQLKKINKEFEHKFNTYKRHLEEQMLIFDELQRSVMLKEEMIDRLKQSEQILDSDLAAANYSLAKVKRLMESYTVPGVMDYILKKVELNNLKKSLKVKKRQKKLEQMIISNQENITRIKSRSLLKIPVDSLSTLKRKQQVIM